MARNQGRRDDMSRRGGRVQSSRISRLGRIAAAALLLILIVGAFGWWAIVREPSPAIFDERPFSVVGTGSRPAAESQSNGVQIGVDLSAAVNELFFSVNPLLPENQYLPTFAKEKLFWIINQL